MNIVRQAMTPLSGRLEDADQFLTSWTRTPYVQLLAHPCSVCELCVSTVDWARSLLHSKHDFWDMQDLLWLVHGGPLQDTCKALQVLGRHQSALAICVAIFRSAPGHSGAAPGWPCRASQARLVLAQQPSNVIF